MTDGKIKQGRIFIAGVDGSEEEVTITGDFRIEKLQLLDAPGGPEVRWEIRDVQPQQVHTRTGSAAEFVTFRKGDFFINGPLRSGGSLTLANVPIPQQFMDAGVIDASQVVPTSRPTPKFSVGDIISIPGQDRPNTRLPKNLPSHWKITDVQWLSGVLRWNYVATDRQGVKSFNMQPVTVNAAAKIEDWPYRGGDFVTLQGQTRGPFKLIRRAKLGDLWPSGNPVQESQLNFYKDKLWILETHAGVRILETSVLFTRAEVKVEKTVTWTMTA